MGIYIGLGIAFVGALLQSTLLNEYQLLGVHADVVLVAVAGWAALRRFEDGFVWALLGGFTLDLFSAGPFGTSFVGLALAALVAALLAGRLRTLNQTLVVATVPFAVVAYYLAVVLLMALGGTPIQPIDLAVSVIGPAIAIDTGLGFVVLFVLAWISHAITPAPWTPQ